jgi:O-antigen/teichoic acid export membrane protein
MTVSKAKTFRNLAYTALTKGTTLVCIAVTSSIVARNLSPSDFGVVGFATIIIMFLLHFSDVGTFNGAIRRPTLSNDSLHTAFTLKLVLSVGAFAFAYAIAPFAHYVFEHPDTGNVVRVLAFNFLTSTIGLMPQIELTREQNFRALSVPFIAGVVVRSAVAVTLVLMGWKFWAVIHADVAATLAVGIGMQLMRKTPLTLHWDSEDAKEYLRFGIPLLGTGVLSFLMFNADNFLVGARLGSALLGYYALAFTWGSFICGLLNDTVNQVLYPAFAIIQNDIVALRRWYLKALDLVAFLAVIANVSLLTNAHYFLTTFLGKGTDKWIPAQTTLQILCLYGILRTATETLANCMTVLGGTKQLLYANAITGVFEIALLLAVLHTRKIEYVAAAVLVAYMTQAAIYLPFLKKTFNFTPMDIISQLWPLVPAGFAGYYATSLLAPTFGDTIITLGARGLFTAVVVAIVQGLCTKFRCFQEAISMLLPKLVSARLDLRES